MLTSSRGSQTQQFHPLDIVMTLATKIVLTYAGINKQSCWWRVWASHVGGSSVWTVPVAATWLKSPCKDWTLLLCDHPSQLFCSHCILSPEYKRSILSSAQAVCSSSFCSLEGKLLLGRLSLRGAAFLLYVFSLLKSTFPGLETGISERTWVQTAPPQLLAKKRKEKGNHFISVII